MILASGDGLLLLIVPVMLLLVVGSVLIASVRSESIIDTWARENGLELLESSRAYFTTAFMFTHSKGQTLYRVRVRDASGRERSGILRCGSYLGGVAFGNQATIKWDD